MSVAGLVVADLLVLVGWMSIVLAFAIRQSPQASWYPSLDWTATNVLPFAAGLFVLFISRGHYSRKLSEFTEIGDVFGGSVAFAGIFLLATMHDKPNSACLWGLAGWATLPFALLVTRRAMRALLDAAGFWKTPVLLVGAHDDLATANALIRLPKALAFHAVGVIAIDQFDDAVASGFWQDALDRHHAERIVLTMDPRGASTEQLLRTIVCDGVPFTMLPTSSSLPVMAENRTVLFSHDTTLMHFGGSGAGAVNRLIKNVLDVSAALFMLVLLAPVMAVLTLLIRRDGGPALFSHERIGAGGQRFQCLKFRSMVTDPATVLQAHFDKNPGAEAEWTVTQKLQDDPRITRIGHFLRATSLDELPQLLNILRRDMSLVGPRPVTEAELERYGADVAFYLRARPGLTGLWQVSGRSDISYARRVELDTWYVRNQSWWHDVIILALTIPAVLKRSGAR